MITKKFLIQSIANRQGGLLKNVNISNGDSLEYTYHEQKSHEWGVCLDVLNIHCRKLITINTVFFYVLRRTTLQSKS